MPDYIRHPAFWLGVSFGAALTHHFMTICTQPPKLLPTTTIPVPESSIPVIYVHGFRGGDYTTNNLVRSAQKMIKSHHFLKVMVDYRGRIYCKGTYDTQHRPLIQLIFEDNWSTTTQITYWFNLALKALQQRYHFETYDAVGHSIGAPALIQALLDQQQDRKTYPTLRRLVLIAGPFDGVMALGDLPNVNRLLPSGRPLLMNPRYIQFLLKRHQFPTHVKVLNVFGNIADRLNTDQYISVTSAKSIRYVLATAVQYYQDLEIFGPDGEHSQLHDRPRVLNLINLFLFKSENVPV